jgi:2EXR family
MSSPALKTSAGQGTGSKEQGTILEPNILPYPQIQTFTFSPHFPMELQNMVWSLAACHTRIIENGGYDMRNKRTRKREFRFTSKTLVPSILHVCSESRATGMKHYEKLSFRERFTGTFINWSVDFVIFSNRSLSQWSSVMNSFLRSKDVKKEITQKRRHFILYRGDRCHYLGREFGNLQQTVKISKILEPYLKPEHCGQRLGDLSLSALSETGLGEWRLVNLRSDKSDLQKL